MKFQPGDLFHPITNSEDYTDTRYVIECRENEVYYINYPHYHYFPGLDKITLTTDIFTPYGDELNDFKKT